MNATVYAGDSSYQVRITFLQEQSDGNVKVGFDGGSGLTGYVGQWTQIAFDGTTRYPLMIQFADPYSATHWRYAGYFVASGSPETW